MTTCCARSAGASVEPSANLQKVVEQIPEAMPSNPVPKIRDTRAKAAGTNANIYGNLPESLRPEPRGGAAAMSAAANAGCED